MIKTGTTTCPLEWLKFYWFFFFSLKNCFCPYCAACGVLVHCGGGGGGLVAQACRHFVTPWTVAHQAPLSTGFSKDTAVGCHFLLQGIFLTQGSNLGLLHCRQMLHNPSQKPLSSLTRDQTQALIVKATGPKNWTARELPRKATIF